MAWLRLRQTFFFAFSSAPEAHEELLTFDFLLDLVLFCLLQNEPVEELAEHG